MSSAADLLIDARGPEIQHRSRLTAPDAFIYLFPEGKKPMVFFDAREFDVQRARLKALRTGVEAIRLEPYLTKKQGAGGDPLFMALMNILKDYRITTVRVSASFPYGMAQALAKEGIRLMVHDYAAERERKNKTEIKHMVAAQRVNEEAFLFAWQTLADSTIRGKRILYKGKTLTSEYMKQELKKFLLDRSYACPDGIIVASGEQTARPHDEGSGPLLPHECIIIDIFPRSEATGFFADMTRTFVKGKPWPEIQKLFADVTAVQKEVATSIQVGDLCSDVHQRTIDAFAKLGHPTSPERGFMHGTGHSLGLSVHESPAFNSRSQRTLESGMVMTVEPGLYYPKLGGVRIEDVVIFSPKGQKQNITRFTKKTFIP